MGVKFPSIYLQVNKSIVEIANGNVIPKEYMAAATKFLQNLVKDTSASKETSPTSSSQDP